MDSDSVLDKDVILRQVEKALEAAAKSKEQDSKIAELEAVVKSLQEQVAALENEKERSSELKSKHQRLRSEPAGEDEQLSLDGFRTNSPKVNQVKALERPRASSDDGIFFFSKLRRACSFEEEALAKPCICDAKITSMLTNPDTDREVERLGYSEGSKSLGRYSIQSREVETHEHHRSGYRLLTCNDDKCFLEEIRSGLVHFPHITKMLVKFKWIRSPKMVLLVKKPRELLCTRMLVSICKFYRDNGLAVVVEDTALAATCIEEAALIDSLHEMNIISTPPKDIQSLPIDFCVCIGGDGTIIWASHLFPKGCPPFVSIAMGSLGFLSTYSVDTARDALRRLLSEEMTLTLRSRLEAHVVVKSGVEKRLETVLNEVVIDRGPNSSLVNVDLFVGSQEAPITHVQGDGLIISTPTGSTAYSLAAGGSMIHPSIPCVAITPICPHTLSFRPIVISDTSLIRLRVPDIARSSAYVSFDGRHQIELRKGDELQIKVSEFPVPCVCAQSESEDWFQAIKHGFKWNERIVQKKHDGDIPSAL